MASGAKYDGISRRGAAIGVGSGIGCLVVRAQVSFGFDNSPGQHTGRCFVDQEFAQQAYCDPLRRRLKEFAREQSSRQPLDAVHALGLALAAGTERWTAMEGGCRGL